MACQKCSSENQSTFNGEVAIHFSGLKGLDQPIVWVFPKLAVCLECGFTEFVVPERELRVLRHDDTSAVNAIVLTERRTPESGKHSLRQLVEGAADAA
jgi:hypothetical protein